MDPAPRQTEEDENEPDIDQDEDDQEDLMGGQPFGEDDDGDEEDLMEADVASSDSELQVEDPNQKNEGPPEENDADDDDPMKAYYDKENIVLKWLEEHPAEKWVDPEFPCNLSQLFIDPTLFPPWSPSLKNLQWRRPEEVAKDAKFMIIEGDKIGKGFEVEVKHGLLANSWFLDALTMLSTRPNLVQKLIVEKEYFDRGFVSFQFFINGEWEQVIVDTLLPYEKEQNHKVCLYSHCANLQQFWIQLMEKALIKVYSNYQKVSQGNLCDGLVDFTGGFAELSNLPGMQEPARELNTIWNFLLNCTQQKFIVGATNRNEGKGIRGAQQASQGILQNHLYTVLELRQYAKEGVKLIRVKNPWGSEGVWTGPFCEEADDWEKYKVIKEDVKNAPKTKKTDGAWWMTLADFSQQFSQLCVSKVFSQNWELYSIPSEWNAKTNGGRCPHINVAVEKDLKETTKANINDYQQTESDDRWFNNPQFRVRVNKDTKVYISLKQEDQKLTSEPYASCGFMIASTKSRNDRLWERPPEGDILAQVNFAGQPPYQRQITHCLTLKKSEKGPGFYIIVPHAAETKDYAKKDEVRRFFLRMISSESIDVTELSETMETSVEGQWNENSAGGSRRIEIKEDPQAKKKKQVKDNPHWCRNPQYFVTIRKPTIVKIILRKVGAKKNKGWKIGLTVCRHEVKEQAKAEKDIRRAKDAAGHSLERLLQQTSQLLEPPALRDIQRKISILPHEKFKESVYFSEEVSALLFRWSPTEGPFIIVPSSDGEDRVFNYRLTFFSNNKIDLIKLDETSNRVVVGRWEKDISAGGCHLSETSPIAAHRTWSMNPKYHLMFREDNAPLDDQIALKITLTIAEKNWKRLNPNTVNGMIGIYLLEKRDGKLLYSPEVVVQQTGFLPVKTITLETSLPINRPGHSQGYIIMPSTYESKVEGAFILSVKCDRPFELTPCK